MERGLASLHAAKRRKLMAARLFDDIIVVSGHRDVWSDLMRDQDEELREYQQYDQRTEPDSPVDAEYTAEEIETNRFWNRFLALAALIGVWLMWGVGSLPLGGAVVLSIMVLIAAYLYRWLFASNTAAKLDENSAGSGKRVGPVTMGTILGYLNDGFKW